MSGQSPNNEDTRLLLSFDEGVVVDRAAGGSSSKILTSGGIVTAAESKFGTHSLLCYGVGNSLKIGAHVDWQFGTTAWVVDAWFKFIDGDPFFFGWWKDSGNFLGIEFVVGGKVGVRAQFLIVFKVGGADAGAETTASSAETILDGAWHHVAMFRGTVPANNVRLGIDGDIVGGTHKLDAATRVDVARWPLYIGRSPRSGADALGDIHGYIDEVRVHNGPLLKNGVAVVKLDTTYDLPTSPYLTNRTLDGQGVHHRYNSSTIEGIGIHLVSGIQVQMDGPGVAHTYNASQKDGAGEHHIRTAAQVDGIGESAIGLTSDPQYHTSRLHAAGFHHVFNASQIDGLGEHVFLTTTVQIDGPGTHHIRIASQNDGHGRHNIMRTMQQDGSGLHTIKSSGDNYHLWYNKDAPPDLDTAADETFASLPFTSLAISGTGVWYFVVRKRNEFGLSSQNMNAFTIELDATDDAILQRPSDPDVFAVAATASGGTIVTAEYGYIVDGQGLASDDKSADAFLIYMTSDGVDPDPAVDSPTVVAMRKSDGVAKLSHEFAAIGDALTVKVIVRTRQTTGRDSTSTTIKQTTTSTGGPAAPVLSVQQSLLGIGVKIA